LRPVSGYHSILRGRRLGSDANHIRLLPEVCGKRQHPSQHPAIDKPSPRIIESLRFGAGCEIPAQTPCGSSSWRQNSAASLEPAPQRKLSNVVRPGWITQPTRWTVATSHLPQLIIGTTLGHRIYLSSDVRCGCIWYRLLCAVRDGKAQY
jgi:hypothetical protein